ncbi:DUF6449 domain-containing protein [Pseudalkalibacillus sp. R45]|uniref:DUF6449 domain-containing protein n=1 Tax=Pseudalkalibacillus sp. R45 TaxID=3457433 RepID=UPI003FCEE07E
MQSKTSWINRELIIHSFRSVGWVALIYLVGLLLVVPMQVLMIWSDENQRGFLRDNIFHYTSVVQFGLICAIPVLLAIFLFRFLHVKNASDFMHSLPLKRTQLYNCYAGMGVLYLVLPVLITGLIMTILYGVLDLEGYYSINDVGRWMGITIVFTLLVYFAGVFVGTVTGLSAVQGVLAYIFLLFPLGITGLFFMNASYYLHGFSMAYYLDSQIIRFSPLSAFVDSMQSNENYMLNSLEIVIYLICSLALYGVGMQIYKRRNLEAVSQPFVFRPLKPIFKYGVVFCVMLLGGVYFSETQRSFNWLIVGYVLGAVFGYFVAEMLLQKTWRVFNRLKGLVIFGVVITVVIVGLQFDITGYESRIPDTEDIEQVFISQGSWAYDNPDWNPSNSPEYYQPYLTSKQNIEAVKKLHEYLIHHKEMFVNYNDSLIEVFMAYELENGDRVIRQYRMEETDKLIQLLKPVYEAAEYKEKTNKIFNVGSDDVTRITVSPDKGQMQEVIIHEPEKIKAALEALKTDVKNEPYTGKNNDGTFASTIRIALSNGSNEEFFLQFKWSYTQFEEWLKDEGELGKARITPEEVEFVMIAPVDSVPYSDFDEEMIEQVLESPKTLKVTTNQEIQESLEAATWGYHGNEYVAIFQFKNSHEQLLGFEGNDIPDFVIEHFE